MSSSGWGQCSSPILVGNSASSRVGVNVNVCTHQGSFHPSNNQDETGETAQLRKGKGYIGMYYGLKGGSLDREYMYVGHVQICCWGGDALVAAV